MKDIKKYAKIGLNHHTLFPCKDDPEHHINTLSRIIQRKDIDSVDLTIPYGRTNRNQAINIIKSSDKSIIYNGYLMPTPKIPLCTLSFTEHSQILMLAKDQVDMAGEVGALFFMQSVGADQGHQQRKRAFECLGEYIYELSVYMAKKGNMAFLIELMDRNMDKKSLCGPIEEVMEFVDKLKDKVPNIGVVLDINHIILMEETFQHAFGVCTNYLKHVHLGNCIFKNRSHPWWGGKHPPIGIEEGEVDVPELADIFKILLDIGYLNPCNPGVLSLEIQCFPGKSPEETIEDNILRINKAWELI